MPIRAVTFDCAQTLLDVTWQPDRFAVECARQAGLQLPDDAALRYSELFTARFQAFLDVNLLKDPQEGRSFYRSLTQDWLSAMDLDPNQAVGVLEQADRLAYGPESIIFRPFPDAIEAIQAVRALDLKVAVISNWDYTLERSLASFGFGPYLEFALASLEEGVEKPEKALFDIGCQRLDLPPAEVLHVGDNPLDDYEGALNAGLKSVLLDRAQAPLLPDRINSLNLLPEVLAWHG